jgi:hypothetical protein
MTRSVDPKQLDSAEKEWAPSLTLTAGVSATDSVVESPAIHGSFGLAVANIK